MESEPLKSNEKTKIKKMVDEADLSGNDEIYKEVSKILGKTTKGDKYRNPADIYQRVFLKNLSW